MKQKGQPLELTKPHIEPSITFYGAATLPQTWQISATVALKPCPPAKIPIISKIHDATAKNLEHKAP